MERVDSTRKLIFTLHSGKEALGLIKLVATPNTDRKTYSLTGHFRKAIRQTSQHAHSYGERVKLDDVLINGDKGAIESGRIDGIFRKIMSNTREYGDGATLENMVLKLSIRELWGEASLK